MTMPLLRVENLSRTLPGRTLWRGISFDLTGGTCLGLVAPTGAGKTLLLRTLAQLDPLETGSLLLRGRSPQDWSLPRYRSLVTYLPQRPVLFEGSGEDNLRLVFDHASQRGRVYDPIRVRHWLASLGRDGDFLERPADRLSGGEAQLLALLRSLQLEPAVLLLDEATASLDPETAGRVELLLRSWLARGDRACVMTSHDPAQMVRCADRRLHLGA